MRKIIEWLKQLFFPTPKENSISIAPTNSHINSLASKEAVTNKVPIENNNPKPIEVAPKPVQPKPQPIEVKQPVEAKPKPVQPKQPIAISQAIKEAMAESAPVNVENKKEESKAPVENKVKEPIKPLVSEEALRSACKEVLMMSAKNIEKHKKGEMTDEALQAVLLRVLCQKINFLVNPEANETFIIQGNTPSAYQDVIKNLLTNRVDFNFVEAIDSELTIEVKLKNVNRLG